MVNAKETPVLYGEVDTSEGLWQRAAMRDAFLTAIQEHAPEVFQELASSVLAGFRMLGEIERMLTWYEIKSQSGTDAGIKIVFDTVNAWAVRWNLDWGKEECYNETMIAFHRALNPDRLPAPFDERILDSIFAREREDLSIPSPLGGLRHYRPTDESRAAYLRYVEAQTLKRLTEDPLLNHFEPSQRVAAAESVALKANDYCAKVEQSYLKAAYVLTDKKRKLDQHLKWLVKVVVMRQTLTEIAECEELEVAAVSKALYRLLKQMDLPKPAHLKRGRIQGSKSKTTKTQRMLGR